MLRLLTGIPMFYFSTGRIRCMLISNQALGGTLESRANLKNVFSAEPGVASSYQLLEIRQYDCGLRPTLKNRSGGKPGSAGILLRALISTENPIFVETSINNAFCPAAAGFRIWTAGCVSRRGSGGPARSVRRPPGDGRRRGGCSSGFRG